MDSNRGIASATTVKSVNSSVGSPTDPSLTRNFINRMKSGAQAGLQTASGSARKFLDVSKANLSFAVFHDYVSPFFSRSDLRPDGFNSFIFAAQEGEEFRKQGHNSFVVTGGSGLGHVTASPFSDDQRDAARTGDGTSRLAGEETENFLDSVHERVAPLPSSGFPFGTPILEPKDVDLLEFTTALKRIQKSDVNSSSVTRENSGLNVSRVSILDTSAATSEISAILNSGASDDNISDVRIVNHVNNPGIFVTSELGTSGNVGSDYQRLTQAAINLKAARARVIQSDGEIPTLTDGRVACTNVSDISAPLTSDPFDAHRIVTVAAGACACDYSNLPA
jgi:hypothetical protein